MEKVWDEQDRAACRAKASQRLDDGQRAFLVVSGKMAAGKDTVAPEILGALRDVLPGAQLNMRFSDLIRADLAPGLDVLREHLTADHLTVVAMVATTMTLKAEHADELVRLLRPEMIQTAGRLTAANRTDGIRTVMQNLGDAWRCVEDPAYWARQATQTALTAVAADASVTFTGFRFLPDVELAHDAGAIIVRLDVSRETQLRRLFARDNMAPSPALLAALDHPGETALDTWEHFDVRLNNDEDGPEALAEVVTEVNRQVNRQVSVLLAARVLASAIC